MKIKPLYIYIAVGVLAVAFLLFFSSDSSKDAEKPVAAPDGREMPQDDIHKGLTEGGNPSGMNVGEDIRMKMEELKKAHEEDPSDTLKARQYADFMSAAHKPDEALPVYEKILKKYPKRTDIRISLAQIWFNKENYSKAEELISSVLGYDKNNQLAQYNLGVVFAAKGDKNKAISIWRNIIKTSPKSPIAMDAEKAIVSVQ